MRDRLHLCRAIDPANPAGRPWTPRQRSRGPMPSAAKPKIRQAAFWTPRASCARTLLILVTATSTQAEMPARGNCAVRRRPPGLYAREDHLSSTGPSHRTPEPQAQRSRQVQRKPYPEQLDTSWARVPADHARRQGHRRQHRHEDLSQLIAWPTVMGLFPGDPSPKY